MYFSRHCYTCSSLSSVAQLDSDCVCACSCAGMCIYVCEQELMNRHGEKERLTSVLTHPVSNHTSKRALKGL